MKSFMNRFQHNIDLLNLSPLFSGVYAVEECTRPLLERYTDSTKLLSPKDST
jgi:hypothetical protein